MGFGNPVREDDGVGIYVIDRLKEKIKHDDIEILDMGTAAFEVLFKLRGRERIILVDAVINTGEAVGTLNKEIAQKIKDYKVAGYKVYIKVRMQIKKNTYMALRIQRSVRDIDL